MQPMIFQTPGFCGYSVQFSPFEENKFAVATSQHFGIVGNGRLYIGALTEQGPTCLTTYDTQDGLFECCWSELNRNQVIVASGDGSIKLFDTSVPEFPIKVFQEHTREVYGLHWNYVHKNLFASGSWDSTVKVWDVERNASFLTFTGHTGCVYSSVFDAIDPNLLASCSSEGIAYVWDIRAQPSPTMSLPHYAQVMAHSHEALSLDWDKYNSMILATASADKSIKVWDLRYVMKEQNYGNLSSPIVTIPGHSYAIRKIKFSPVHTMTLASASYDMTCKIWNADALNTKLIKSYENHREFVVGIDFNMYIEGLVASCSWDQTVQFFKI